MIKIFSTPHAPPSDSAVDSRSIKSISKKYQWKTVAVVMVTAVAVAAIAYYAKQYLEEVSYPAIQLRDTSSLSDTPTAHCLAVDPNQLVGHPCESLLGDLQKRVDGLFPGSNLKVVPPIPTDTFPISAEASSKWVNALCLEEERQAAAKLVKSITHVDHLRFETALSQAVGKFNHWLTEQPLKNFSLKVTHQNYEKSDRWVGELALRHFAVLPTSIIDIISDIRTPETDPENAIDVLIDDAAYSCSQLGKKIEDYQYALHNQKNLAVIVPFMRDPHCLNDKISSSLVTLNVFTSEVMPSIDQLLSHQDLQTLSSYSLDRFGLTLTYFDHKIADDWSFPENIKRGYVRPCEDQLRMSRQPFFPEIVPPYKTF